MSNFFSFLRFCEHIANYVFNGHWYSAQMADDGFMDFCPIYIETERFKRRFKSINLYSYIRDDWKRSQGKVYSFTSGHDVATQ